MHVVAVVMILHVRYSRANIGAHFALIVNNV